MCVCVLALYAVAAFLDKVIKVVISSAAPHHGDNAAIVIDGVDVSLHEKGVSACAVLIPHDCIDLFLV